MLIHIKPSNTLTKWLLKQKNKHNSIKIVVNWIQQALLLPNRVSHHMTSNLIKEWSPRNEDNEDRRHAERMKEEWRHKTYRKDDRRTKTEDMQKDMTES